MVYVSQIDCVVGGGECCGIKCVCCFEFFYFVVFIVEEGNFDDDVIREMLKVFVIVG